MGVGDVLEVHADGRVIEIEETSDASSPCAFPTLDAKPTLFPTDTTSSTPTPPLTTTQPKSESKNKKRKPKMEVKPYRVFLVDKKKDEEFMALALAARSREQVEEAQEIVENAKKRRTGKEIGRS